MKKLIFVLLLTSSCITQKKFSNYLVTVTPNNARTQVHHLQTSIEVDSVLQKSTGLTVVTDKLITDHTPYFDMKNGKYYIYVEKMER